MKIWSNDQMNRLWKVLAVTYREREKAGEEGHWQEAVMNRVLALGPYYNGNGYLELFEGFVWRYVPVAGILILVLAAALLRLDILPDYSLVQYFVEDSLNYSFMDYIG